MLDKTNYIIACDYEKKNKIEGFKEIPLLCYNYEYKTFDTSRCGEDIILYDFDDLPVKIKGNNNGLIKRFMDNYICAGETIEIVREYANSAQQEGFNVTILKIEMINDEIELTPIN